MSNVSQSVFISNLPTSLIYLISSLIHFSHHKNSLTFFFFEKILSWTTSLYIYEGSQPSRKTAQETTLSPLASILLYIHCFPHFPNRLAHVLSIAGAVFAHIVLLISPSAFI